MKKDPENCLRWIREFVDTGIEDPAHIRILYTAANPGEAIPKSENVNSGTENPATLPKVKARKRIAHAESLIAPESIFF